MMATVKPKITRSGKAAFPKSVKPTLATLTKEPFNNSDWVYEVKWDGFRILSHLNKKTVKLFSRSGQDYTRNYTAIANELSKLKHDAIIDGELVVIDESGKPNFDDGL